MSDGEQQWKERFSRLAAEAREAWGSERAERVGVLNALVSALPEQVGPERGAVLLRELLESPPLEGLEDEAGLSVQAAATRALLSLEGLAPLTVPPERLDALRRWERRPYSASGFAVTAVLLVTFVMQVGFVTLMSPGFRPPPGVSAALLAGEPEPEPAPPWVRGLTRLCENSVTQVVLGQLMANAVGLVATLGLAAREPGRRWVRRGFFALGLLGLGVAGVQAAVGLRVAGSTLLSAGGSWLAAGWLRRR